MFDSRLYNVLKHKKQSKTKQIKPHWSQLVSAREKAHYFIKWQITGVMYI